MLVFADPSLANQALEKCVLTHLFRGGKLIQTPIKKKEDGFMFLLNMSVRELRDLQDADQSATAWKN